MMEAQEPDSVREPEAVALTMEGETAGSDTWSLVPGASDTPGVEDEGEQELRNEKENDGEEKAREEEEDEGEQKEGQSKKAQAEEREWRKHCQQQIQEAESRLQDVKEVASMWQERAAEEKKMRVKAEADSALWENKAEREDGLRKKAERDLADMQRMAKTDEALRNWWEEKALVEEKLCARYEQKAKTEESHHAHWRREAEEKALLLEEKAALFEQEAALRQKAEMEASEWRSNAQQEESCRARAEEELEQWKRKAEEEETFKNDCERKAKVEASLRKEWQEKALQREQDMEACVLAQFEDKLKAKDAQLAEAKAVEDTWRSKAERLEEENEKVKKQTEEKEGLMKESEEKADAAAKSWQDKTKRLEEEVDQWKKKVDEHEVSRRRYKEKVDATIQSWRDHSKRLEGKVEQQEGLKKRSEEQAHLLGWLVVSLCAFFVVTKAVFAWQATEDIDATAYARPSEPRSLSSTTAKLNDDPITHSMSLVKRSLVSYTFKGFKAAREANKELLSPELTFQGIDNQSLSYSFMLKLCPNGGGDAWKGAVGLFWVPRVSSRSPGELTWPIPHEQVKIVLRILSEPSFCLAVGRAVCTGGRVKEDILDGTTDEGARAFFARHAPPSTDNSQGRGDRSLLTKKEFEQGGWTMGHNDDIMVVQAELTLK